MVRAMVRSGAPARAASVENPRRSEWPAKSWAAEACCMFFDDACDGFGAKGCVADVVVSVDGSKEWDLGDGTTSSARTGSRFA